MLPDAELSYLAQCWPDHQLEQVGGQVAVVLRAFPLPEGFEPRAVDLLLLLPFGFPDVRPDMFWTSPEVTLRGSPPLATEVREHHLGRVWQRFSRHLGEGAWRAGVDGLQTYVALILTTLSREAGPGARAA